MTFLQYFCLFLLALLCRVEGASNSNKLIMLFVDGLRWDSFDRADLPGFRTLLESGTRAHHLTPVFPTLCYPNFYTMVTGLYPESHGLIGNNIYDPIARDFFISGNDPEKTAGDHWWDGGEPIWVTAKKQGKSSYLYYLAGCDRKIQGYAPEFCLKVRNDLSITNLVMSVQHGLSKIEEGVADFVGVYYGEIDTLGHRYGPTSPQLRQKVKDLDGVLSFLQRDLWERGLSKTTNLVLVSDHGMTHASIDRTINLNSMVSKSDVDKVLEAGAYVSIWPKPDKLQKVYLTLKAHPRLHVYFRDEIPASWHYKASDRVAPITVVAELGWYIVTHEVGYLGFGDKKTPALGMHGYLTDHPDMWGVFVAAGPDININQSVGAVGIADVYQMLAHLLDVDPEPHNGTWQNVAPMFRAASASARRQQHQHQQPLMVGDGFEVAAFASVRSSAHVGRLVCNTSSLSSLLLLSFFITYRRVLS